MALDKAIEHVGAMDNKRAVIDVISPALKTFDFETIYRLVQTLKAKLSEKQITTILLIEKEMHDTESIAALGQLCDGVIDVTTKRDSGGLVRQLTIPYLRGTKPTMSSLVVKVDKGKLIVVIDEEILGKPADFKRRWHYLGSDER